MKAREMHAHYLCDAILIAGDVIEKVCRGEEE